MFKGANSEHKKKCQFRIYTGWKNSQQFKGTEN